jgi:predicted glycosyltransferase
MSDKSILIDINHPSQVHLFRHFIREMSQNHRVIVTAKDDPLSNQLLKLYRIPFVFLGNKSDSIMGKGLSQLAYNYKVLNLIQKYGIRYGLGTSVTINQLSRVTRMISFFFDDDDSKVQPLTRWFANPFAHYIITPRCLLHEHYGRKHLTYPGYHELAYLHPRRFKPDSAVLKLLNVREDEPFFILRFNAFRAHHDIGVSGLSGTAKRELVSLLQDKGKLFITTEGEIESEFRGYQLRIPQDKIHSALYYATMFIGDSQTMASESGVLGTPSVRNNSLVGKISYLEELEKKYGLTYGFLPEQSERMFKKIVELLRMKDLKKKWEERKNKMLRECIDLADFMIWLVDDYPASVQLLRSDPEYARRFIGTDK